MPTLETLLAADQAAADEAQAKARAAFASLALTLADDAAEDPPEAVIRQVVQAHRVRDLSPVDPQRPAAHRSEIVRQATLVDLRFAVDRARKRRALVARARSTADLGRELAEAKTSKRAAEERLEAVKKQLEEQLRADDDRLRGLSAALGDAKQAQTKLAFMGPAWAVTELEIQAGFAERKALVSRRDQAAFLARSLQRLADRLERQIRGGEGELSLPKPKRSDSGGIGGIARLMPWHKGNADERKAAIYEANKRLDVLRQELDEKRAELRQAKDELAAAEAALVAFDQAQEGSLS